MTRLNPAVLTALLLATFLITPARLEAQVISPGKLSSVHGDLEGVRGCTNCHELSKSGALNGKCLDCHELLQNRLRQRLGYHATVADRDCASCHAEHRGREASMIELDKQRFDHGEVGFDLVAAHRDVPCEDCHQPEFITAADVRSYTSKHGALERTYLGLGTTCVTCHDAENPHSDQFAARGCRDCHSEENWEATDGFDHDQTRYRLTGQHRDTSCKECHEPTQDRNGATSVRFAPLDFSSCESCHNDVHKSDLGKDCTRCHDTGTWHRVERTLVERRFDHSRTQFRLLGKHADAECETCHGGPVPPDKGLRISFKAETRSFAYPHPFADACTSCHTDYHRGVFSESPGGRACDNCHDDDGWIPAKYDIARHNREARYALEGAHLAVICTDCHPSRETGEEAAQFQSSGQGCSSCHESDDPHGEQFGVAPCEDCHDVRAFAIETFDHSATRYPLDGAHRDVPCQSCHDEIENPDGSLTRRYRPLGTDCKDCHGGSK
ncbi:MAG: hypothetical protein JSU87_16485 [Gemmatimonadota bacterium]|nr:MAG: hypothetical protein JSU87_16485 [Gemmatimonadota bacterium]